VKNERGAFMSITAPTAELRGAAALPSKASARGGAAVPAPGTSASGGGGGGGGSAGAARGRPKGKDAEAALLAAAKAVRSSDTCARACVCVYVLTTYAEQGNSAEVTTCLLEGVNPNCIGQELVRVRVRCISESCCW
jgi:hypothetical protein